MAFSLSLILNLEEWMQQGILTIDPSVWVDLKAFL